MNTRHKLVMATALAATVTLTGCWSDDDQVDDPVVTPPAVITEVPASAGASIASFVAFLLSLSATDESSEPLTIGDSFAVPADESSEPATLT